MIKPYPYGWADCFAMLQRAGFSPQRVLDVGANHGHWTRAAVSVFPSAEYVLVEPQDYMRADVQDLIAQGHRLKWVTAGVSDTAGQLLLTIAPDDVSSNFLIEPAEATSMGLAQVPVRVRTINEIVATELGAPPELVKIDAEGLDLKALAGASDLWGKTEIFFVEAAVCAPRIENTMAAVMAAMSRAGYRMIDIVDLNRSPRDGVLWLCELVFLREGSPLLASYSSYR